MVWKLKGTLVDLLFFPKTAKPRVMVEFRVEFWLAYQPLCDSRSRDFFLFCCLNAQRMNLGQLALPYSPCQTKEKKKNMYGGGGGLQTGTTENNLGGVWKLQRKWKNRETSLAAKHDFVQTIFSLLLGSCVSVWKIWTFTLFFPVVSSPNPLMVKERNQLEFMFPFTFDC